MATRLPSASAMIDQHHKPRPAGAALEPMEIFRRTDWTDVSLGTIRFGLPHASYRALLREISDAGFHRKLLKLSWQANAHQTVEAVADDAVQYKGYERDGEWMRFRHAPCKST